MTRLTDDEIRDISKGRAAQAELAQLEEAFADVREDLIKVIEGSRIDEANVREHAYAALHVLKAVRQRLINLAAGADKAEGMALMRAILDGEAEA